MQLDLISIIIINMQGFIECFNCIYVNFKVLYLIKSEKSSYTYYRSVETPRNVI